MDRTFRSTPGTPISPDSRQPESPPELRLSPSWVFPLAGIALVFLVATAAAHLAVGRETSNLFAFDMLVDVDAEGNLPTWFASFILHGCAFVALLIGHSDRSGNRWWWYGAAFLLLLMGLDEVASIHNSPSRRVREVTGVQDGWLLNAWILPALVLVAAVGIGFFRFWLRLPRRLAWGLALAGILFLTGAVGLELIGSRFEFEAGGEQYDGLEHYSLTFELIAVGEEAFEYAGTLLTLFLLLRHAEAVGSAVTFRAGRRKTS